MNSRVSTWSFEGSPAAARRTARRSADETHARQASAPLAKEEGPVGISKGSGSVAIRPMASDGVNGGGKVDLPQGS
jgi:hypothetical protein